MRKWLKEMEVRINPVQFNKAEEWNTRDRERKMAEYQVFKHNTRDKHTHFSMISPRFEG